MSTKIHDGKAIHGNISAYHLKGKTDVIREECRKIAYEIAIRKIASCITQVIDKSENGIGKYDKMSTFFYKKEERTTMYIPENIVSFFIELFIEKRRKIKKTGGRNPFYDMDLMIAFYPLKDKTLYLVDSEQKELRKKAHEILGGQDHGYWDNMDPDENLTEQQWDQRRKDWNEAFNDHDNHPSGFTFELFGEYDYLSGLYSFKQDELYSRIIKNISSYKERKRRIAFNKLVNENVEKEIEDNNIDKRNELGKIHEIIKKFEKYYLKDEKGKKELNDLCKEIKTPKITKELIKEKNMINDLDHEI